MICGAHNASAVAETQTLGAGMVAAARSSAVLRGDLQSVSAELAALRQTGGPLDPRAWSAETALVSQPVY